MPVRSVNIEYARWLAGAPTRGLLMTAVELNWAGNQFFYMGNHILVPTNVLFENGASITLAPVQFECSQADRSGTTEAAVTLRAPMGAELFNLFQFLRGYQAANFGYMYMKVRYYIIPGLTFTPLSNKPERYYVTSITYSRTAIVIEAAMARLPRYRAGIPYTVDEYPGLYEF